MRTKENLRNVFHNKKTHTRIERASCVILPMSGERRVFGLFTFLCFRTLRHRLKYFIEKIDIFCRLAVQ